MNPNDKELLNALRSADSFESSFDGDSHLVASNQVAGISKPSQHPVVEAQFDLEIKTFYTNQATGAIVTAANLPASLQTGQPVYLFGHIDYAGGYAVAQSKLQRNGAWLFSQLFRYNVDAIAGTPNIQNALINAKNGDFVTLWEQTVAGTTYNMVQIITSANVAYSSLIEALSSDRFIISKLRLNVQNSNFATQFKNSFYVIKQTLFGKTSDDILSANSFVNPFNNLQYICDVPIHFPVDKNKTLAFNMNYDCQDETISVYVKTVAKLQA